MTWKITEIFLHLAFIVRIFSHSGVEKHIWMRNNAAIYLAFLGMFHANNAVIQSQLWGIDTFHFVYFPAFFTSWNLFPIFTLLPGVMLPAHTETMEFLQNLPMDYHTGIILPRSACTKDRQFRGSLDSGSDSSKTF